jgi:hypothetical protein
MDLRVGTAMRAAREEFSQADLVLIDDGSDRVEENANRNLIKYPPITWSDLGGQRERRETS